MAVDIRTARQSGFHPLNLGQSDSTETVEGQERDAVTDAPRLTEAITLGRRITQTGANKAAADSVTKKLTRWQSKRNFLRVPNVSTLFCASSFAESI